MTRKNEVRDSIYSFPDLHILAESTDERDKNLYKKIISFDARWRATWVGRKNSIYLHGLAKKRIKGISWKEINIKPTVY